MTITFLQPDGVPITAQAARQGNAAVYGGGSGRPLGGRSGFRVGTPATILTATSTTWTLLPCSAMLDPGASTHQGMYGWASDANITGAVTASDVTNARKDIVYIQVNDSSSGDGSGLKTANVSYLAGTPSGTPTAPALPARSFLVGTIDVPKTGAGSPTVTLNPARFVTAGAVLPIFSPAERAALTPYLGMEIRRHDLTQAGASGVLERWNGTTWDHFGFAQWTSIAGGVPGGGVNSAGGVTAVPAKTTDSAFVTVGSNMAVTFRDAGTYTVEWTGKWTVGSPGRSFFSIDASAAPAAGATTHSRSPVPATEDTGTVTATIIAAAGEAVYINVFRASGTSDVSGFLRVSRKYQ